VVTGARVGATFRRRFARERSAVVALVALGLLALFAFAGPSLWHYGHTLHRDLPVDQAPTWSHPFGTDRAGHDLMGQVMRGTRQSLLVGVVAAALGTAIGSAVGLVAAFRRGRVDAVLMRLVDVVLIVPGLVVVLVVAGSTHGTSWLRIAVLIGLVSWPRPARVVRGLALSEVVRDYVEAARALGLPPRRILTRHVLANVAPAVAVDATFAVTVAILSEAALSFLGFGFTVPDTSLGLLVSTGQGAIATRPWLFYIPGAFLIALCVLVHLVGDGLRAALGPTPGS
jgi:peptide/nickel transport system permease protein